MAPADCQNNGDQKFEPKQIEEVSERHTTPARENIGVVIRMKNNDRIRKKILFIDDEEMILEVGSAMLEILEYEVICARGGVRGLHLYMKNRDTVDLVILDMLMPGLGGEETYDRLREINPSVKVLLSTGYGLDSDVRRIMEKGCNGFIQKPYSREDLLKKLRTILDSG